MCFATICSLVLAPRSRLLRARTPQPAYTFVPEELRMGVLAPMLHTLEDYAYPHAQAFEQTGLSLQGQRWPLLQEQA